MKRGQQAQEEIRASQAELDRLIAMSEVMHEDPPWMVYCERCGTTEDDEPGLKVYNVCIPEREWYTPDGELVGRAPADTKQVCMGCLGEGEVVVRHG